MFDSRAELPANYVFELDEQSGYFNPTIGFLLHEQFAQRNLYYSRRGFRISAYQKSVEQEIGKIAHRSYR